MSGEAVTKKRGRPKKVAQVEVTVDVDAKSAESGPRRKNGSIKKSASISPKEPVTAEKRTNRKKESPLSSNDQARPEVGIAGQANAFNSIKQSVQAFSDGSGLTTEQLLQTDEVLHATQETSFVPADAKNSEHLQDQSIINHDGEGANAGALHLQNQSYSEATPAERLEKLSSKHSLFLSAFLDDAKNQGAPMASENAKFSDRSAMKPEIPSVDDIIRGQGVSSFTDEGTNAQMKPSIIDNEDKHTKRFESLSISKFPVNSQDFVGSSLPPASYTYASFSSFKQSPALQSQASNSVPSKPRVAPPKAQTLPTQPAPTLRATVDSKDHPVRPTEMSFEEISKQPKYQQLRWKYTVLMVGVPVILVTSWVLWKRLSDEQTKSRQRRNSLSSTLGIDRTNSNSSSNGGV